MEKDRIFFGNEGLTSTSANFIANLAKELYAQKEQQLNSMVFYTTTVKLISDSETNLLRAGASSVTDVPNTLKEIANLKSLIAWLREAIKAKERLISEAQSLSYEDCGLELPEKPVREDYISSDDVIASFNIKQRNRYYYLEAVCATIGKYIHPDGVFSNEREQLLKIINEPNTVSGSGRDTLLYTRKPSLPPSQVEETFMSLQQTYREYQAELNSIKHQIEDTVNKDTAQKNIDYAEKINQYKAEMAAIDAKLTAARNESVNQVSSLKIVIPDSLKAIFDTVKNTGKE